MGRGQKPEIFPQRKSPRTSGGPQKMISVVENPDPDPTGVFAGFQFYVSSQAQEGPDGVPRTSYDKDIVEEILLNEGATLVEEVGTEAPEDVSIGVPDVTGGANRSIFLITDGPIRTKKYIYSLAKGIPCVHLEWVQICAQERRAIPWGEFWLARGMSKERNVEIPAGHDYPSPLSSVKICFSVRSKRIERYWKPVLDAANARIMCVSQRTSCRFRKTGIHPRADVVLLTSRNSEVEASACPRIPRVSPEWIVQSIITGVRADTSRRDLYSYQFAN